MIACTKCKQVITGKNVVIVVDTMVFHELCMKAREAKTSVHSDYKVITDCALCEMIDFLVEEPIPIITDWKLNM